MVIITIMASFITALAERVPSIDLIRGFSLAVMEEPPSASTDPFLLSIIMDALALGKPVLFIAFRENYAHYLSLSKKLGGSL